MIGVEFRVQVDSPYLLGCLFVADVTFRGNGIPHLVSDSHTRRPSTKDDHADVGQFLFVDL